MGARATAAVRGAAAGNGAGARRECNGGAASASRSSWRAVLKILNRAEGRARIHAVHSRGGGSGLWGGARAVWRVAGVCAKRCGRTAGSCGLAPSAQSLKPQALASRFWRGGPGPDSGGKLCCCGEKKRIGMILFTLCAKRNKKNRRIKE